MQSWEIAYELHRSQIISSLHKITKDLTVELRRNNGRSCGGSRNEWRGSGASVGLRFIETGDRTQSTIDLRRLNELNTKLNQFAEEFIENPDFSTYQQSVERSYSYDGEWGVDHDMRGFLSTFTRRAESERFEKRKRPRCTGSCRSFQLYPWRSIGSQRLSIYSPSVYIESVDTALWMRIGLKKQSGICFCPSLDKNKPTKSYLVEVSFFAFLIRPWMYLAAHLRLWYVVQVLVSLQKCFTRRPERTGTSLLNAEKGPFWGINDHSFRVMGPTEKYYILLSLLIQLAFAEGKDVRVTEGQLLEQMSEMLRYLTIQARMVPASPYGWFWPVYAQPCGETYDILWSRQCSCADCEGDVDCGRSDQVWLINLQTEVVCIDTRQQRRNECFAGSIGKS